MGGEPAAEAPGVPADKRGEVRKAFLKRAQLVYDGAGFDCIVENMSAGGARVRLGNPIVLPETLALRFHDGSTHPARRCWSRGAVVGLQFSGKGPAAEAERRHLAEAIQEAATASDPAEVLRLLRQVWFFGDEDLRRAAEGFEISQARFVAALSPHVTDRAYAPRRIG